MECQTYSLSAGHCLILVITRIVQTAVHSFTPSVDVCRYKPIVEFQCIFHPLSLRLTEALQFDLSYVCNNVVCYAVDVLTPLTSQ